MTGTRHNDSGMADLFRNARESQDAYARRDDPGTSHEAADHMNATGQTTKLEAEVHAFLKKGGRWTAIEIAEALGRDKWSISPRLAPLKRKGLVREDGRKAALNSSGRVREQTAWIATKL